MNYMSNIKRFLTKVNFKMAPFSSGRHDKIVNIITGVIDIAPSAVKSLEITID